MKAILGREMAWLEMAAAVGAADGGWYITYTSFYYGGF